MSLSILINELEILANAPNGMSLLRTMILDLALSGELNEEKIEFESKLLGDIAVIRTGKLDANASSADGLYPFFTCAKDPLRISTFSYDTECVLLAGNGNFDVNYYSGKFDAYQRTYILEPKNKEELFVPFLFRFMQSHARKLTEQSIGGVIKYLKIGFLTSAPIRVPSFNNQKLIVAVIDSLMSMCDEIELRINRRESIRNSARSSAIDAVATAQTAEDMQAAWRRIKQNWEVMTDTADSVSDLRRLIETLGVRGQLTEKINVGDTAEDLLRDLGLSGDVFTTDEIDLVPRNWAFTNLGAIIQLEYGKSLPKQIRSTEGKIPVYGSNGIVGYHDEALIENGSIVVGRKGSIGQVNIARGESWIIDTAYYVVPKADMPLEYLALLIKTSNLQFLNKATAIPGLNRNDAYSQRCFLAPPEEQIRIVQTVNALLEVCDRLAEALQERENIALKFARSAVSESL